MRTPHAEARLTSNDFDTSALQVHRVLGREAISQLYRFEIDFVTLERAPLALRDLAGAEASLVFEVEGEAARTVHGMIAEATDLLTSEPGHRSYRIVLVPRMHRLALVELPGLPDSFGGLDLSSTRQGGGGPGQGITLGPLGGP